jgi:hypothetical protein
MNLLTTKWFVSFFSLIIFFFALIKLCVLCLHEVAWVEIIFILVVFRKTRRRVIYCSLYWIYTHMMQMYKKKIFINTELIWKLIPVNPKLMIAWTQQFKISITLLSHMLIHICIIEVLIFPNSKLLYWFAFVYWGAGFQNASLTNFWITRKENWMNS